jgi:hypothetical protein
MTDQLEMINRRMEWMAASALATGTITVAGDGFPTQVIDFGRDPTLTLALSGTAQWLPANVQGATGGPGTATPVGNIEAWQHQILKMSGARVSDIVFSTSAWTGFIGDPLLRGAIYYPRLGEAGSSIDIGSAISAGAIYKGRWGQYDLWLYNEWAVDENNVERPLVPDGSVILSGPEMMGTRAYAQIIDPDFNYEAMPYAPKTWTQKDPAQRFLMMQSAPVVIPSRVNASMCVQVCPPVFN